jgi:stage V sporulation protein D (sporulation-specific penicillin-binding protein)
VTSKKTSTKITKKRRLALIYFVVFILFSALLGRLIYITAVDSKKLKKEAAKQWTSNITIGAKRGNILDRNGNELAVSADVYRIDFDLLTLRRTLEAKADAQNSTSDKSLSAENKAKVKKNNLAKVTSEFASNLASILNIDVDEVNKALNKTLDNGLPASWAPLKRQVEKPEADKVKALKFFGVLVSSDSKRYYPNNNFLSQVIGHIGENENGIAGVTGIEQFYNKELTGTNGTLVYERDSASNQLFFEDSRYTKPVDGKNIILTVDFAIQDFVEKAAQNALEKNKAKSVSIMVMNPKNGEVLAMASKPDYNLNMPKQGAKSSDELFNMWKNRSVANIFEPGSIFKVITAAAAMEYGTSKESDKFVCNGSSKIANRTINCWDLDGHGTESFVDILKNSCNVGFMEVGKKLGKDNLYAFIKKIGFGQKTGVDLPGEQDGIVKHPKDMNEVDLATESFGQSISITQVQYMAAFNAIANGGTWIKPHLMKNLSYYDENGKLVLDKVNDNPEKRQVLDSSMTNTLRGYLEKVVSDGVGANAFIKEYSIGGKTGTAQKVIDGVYQDKKYMSSFAGLAPYDDPKVTMVITVDEPDASNYYAGQTAAPVAKELFNNIFNYLAINPQVLE